MKRLLLTISLLLPGLLLSVNSRASSVTVSPASAPVDYENVRQALHRLVPGDTLILNSGIFDWSQNVADSSSGLRGGLAIPTGGVTILGRKGAALKGAVDAKGEPLRMAIGTNAAFKNGPGVDNVTISGLAFQSFENAIVLLQGDTLSWAKPVDAWRGGTRGWTLEDLSVKAGPFGVSVNGRHSDLTIRRCRFEMDPGKPRKGQEGSFAISVRPFPPAYNGIPERIVIEDNVIFGPESETDQKMYAGIIVTGEQSVVRKNSVERYGMGLVVEGRAMEVTGNRVSRCGIGIVAWTTGRLGTKTEAARIERNELRSMSRRGDGFLAEFSGSGILVAGLTKSTIANNIVSANAGADIIFGAIRTTSPSVGNKVTGNGGVVLLSKQSLDANTVEGSTTMVRDLSKPGEAEKGKKN